MKYMGSKNRYAKDLLNIILKDRLPDQYYVEPFCGGCNIIDKVTGPRIANDSNPYVIAYLQRLSEDWLPPTELSLELYNDIKEHKDTKYSKEMVAFAGICCSYGAKWFGGYSRGKNGSGLPRNYARESYDNAVAQAPFLKGISFSCKNYYDMCIPIGSIVYCDPPYQGTTKYKDSIDYNYYWDWVRALSNSGFRVFCSEYNAPTDFECIWERTVFNSLTKDTGGKSGVEKLFVYRG